MKNKIIKCQNFEISNDKQFTLISGPCQLESEDHAIEIAGNIKEISKKLNINFIYKTSFDKANRTNLASKRGIGLDKSLKILLTNIKLDLYTKHLLIKQIEQVLKVKEELD